MAHALLLAKALSYTLDLVKGFQRKFCQNGHLETCVPLPCRQGQGRAHDGQRRPDSSWSTPRISGGWKTMRLPDTRLDGHGWMTEEDRVIYSFLIKLILL